MYNFNKGAIVKIVGGVVLLSVVASSNYYLINSDIKAQRTAEEVKQIRQLIESNQQKTEEMLNNNKTELQLQLEQRMEQYKEMQKQLEKLEKDVQNKLSYTDNMSSAIRNTSDLSKAEADKLAKTTDKVTSEFQDKYGFKKDDPKILAMMYVESRFHNLSANSAGARGLLQITPSCLEQTNEWTGWNYSNSDMFDPEKNIKVAWYYYNYDVNRHGVDKATVAYNQGYRNLSKAVAYSRGNSKSYLNKVGDMYIEYSQYFRR